VLPREEVRPAAAPRGGGVRDFPLPKANPRVPVRHARPRQRLQRMCLRPPPPPPRSPQRTIPVPVPVPVPRPISRRAAPPALALPLPLHPPWAWELWAWGPLRGSCSAARGCPAACLSLALCWPRSLGLGPLCSLLCALLSRSLHHAGPGKMFLSVP